MRVFTKRFLIAILSIFLGLSIVSCNKEKTTTELTIDSVVPEITNPDGVFLSTGDYDITYSDLYEEIKKNDGLNQLLTMVDTVLLSSYISSVTQQEIDDKIIKLTYGTSDPEEIAKLDADTKASQEKSFTNSMYLLGYSNDLDSYIKLLVAKEKYAKDQLVDDTNSDETWYINTDTIIQRYQLQHYPDVKTIRIRFSTESDVNSTLKALNLVPNKGQLLLYTGETPLDQISVPADLNETNSRSLSTDEILHYFLTMYNQVYGGYLDPIDENSTYSDILNDERFNYDYDSLKNVNTKLPSFIYDSLGSYQNVVNGIDDKAFYTYEPVKYNSSGSSYYFMILNLEVPEKADLSNFTGTKTELKSLITEDVYNDIEAALIQENLDSKTFITNRMIDLRSLHGLVINDYYLGLDYKLMNHDYEVTTDGDASIVASYDDVNITADELLTYALNINAPLYALYASQTKAAIAAHYQDVYCTEDQECEYDVTKNVSDKMEKHRADMAAAKTDFESGGYAAYYTYQEYIYLAYGAKSEADLLKNSYVKSTLQPLYIYDQIKKDNYADLSYLAELMKPFYDNYFNLKVKHILIYVDRDEDGSPDDYDKFYAGLDGEKKTAYDDMLTQFESAIRNYLSETDENTMATLKSDYNNASNNDDIWGMFKRFGFYLLYENLGDLTYVDTIDSYEKPFTNALIDMYQMYNLDENINKNYLLNDSLVQTSFGEHLIYVQKGENFVKPNGLFAMEYDKDGSPLYPGNLINMNKELTFNQIKAYANHRFMEISLGSGDLEAIYGLTSFDIPDSLQKAFDAYISKIYDGYYVVGYMNVAIAKELISGTYNKSDYCDFTSAQFTDKLDNIINIYMDQIFDSFDHTTD